MELSTRSQKKVDSIVYNATQLFIRHGFTKVTMDSIAQYANVSKVTLYKYFNDKQVLYEHIVKEMYTKEVDDVRDIVNGYDDFKEKLHKLLIIQTEKHFNTNMLVPDPNFNFSLSTTKLLKKFRERMRTFQKRLYEEGIKNGYIESKFDLEMIRHFFAVIQKGIIEMNINPSEEETEPLIDLLYKGVLKGYR